MEVFTLIVDEKVAVWRRSTIEIEAQSLGEAVETCLINGINCTNDILDSEYLPETEEYINKDVVNHPVTIEVMDDHYNLLGSDEHR